eukprot:scaffold250056_cov21-Tisochrysis_lutea.AAC.1
MRLTSSTCPTHGTLRMCERRAGACAVACVSQGCLMHACLRSLFMHVHNTLRMCERHAGACTIAASVGKECSAEKGLHATSGGQPSRTYTYLSLVATPGHLSSCRLDEPAGNLSPRET